MFCWWACDSWDDPAQLWWSRSNLSLLLKLGRNSRSKPITLHSSSGFIQNKINWYWWPRSWCRVWCVCSLRHSFVEWLVGKHSVTLHQKVILRQNTFYSCLIIILCCGAEPGFHGKILLINQTSQDRLFKETRKWKRIRIRLMFLTFLNVDKEHRKWCVEIGNTLIGFSSLPPLPFMVPGIW